MSDTSSFGFGQFVPGFEFLQNLANSANAASAKTATSGLSMPPGLANWVAPTLSVEELDKRIDELKTVQFWLDQNATALKATIQALEVQKMTLATLKGMNFSLGEMAQAFQIKPAAAPAAEAPPPPVSKPTPEPAPAPARDEPVADAPAAAPEAPAVGVVDPMQWWGALTQQFQQIAASAMKDAGTQTALDSARQMASNAMKAATDAAGQPAAPKAASARQRASGATRKTASKTAGKTASRKRPAA